ncbi:NADH:ubiquinone oxidoreductase subunit J, partial [Mycobacterium kansasii]
MIVHIVYWIAAVISVLAGAAVFRVNSMARATYALAVSFVAVG